jgi:Rod binding domain-containing protein
VKLEQATAAGMAGGNASMKAQALTSRGTGPEAARLRQACQDFEAIFISTLLRGARQSGGVGATGATQLYVDMADSALATAIAKSGGIGIGRMMESQLIIHTERSKSPDP